MTDEFRQQINLLNLQLNLTNVGKYTVSLYSVVFLSDQIFIMHTVILYYKNALDLNTGVEFSSLQFRIYRFLYGKDAT